MAQGPLPGAKKPYTLTHALSRSSLVQVICLLERNRESDMKLCSMSVFGACGARCWICTNLIAWANGDVVFCVQRRKVLDSNKSVSV